MPTAQPLESSTDLTSAFDLVRGDRQRRWIEEMLDHERGLRPGDGANGRWASATYKQVEAWVWRVRSAGYMVEKRPIGPRRIPRFVITGYSEIYGLAARASVAGVRGAIDELGVIHPGVASLSAPQLEALASLITDWKTDIDDLVKVVKRLVP